MPYHYPMLMGDAYSHGSLLEPEQQGKVTAASSDEQLLGSGNIRFNTYQQTKGWWLWKSDYLYVNNSDRDSLSELVYAAMPN